MPPRWLARLVLACYPKGLRDRYSADLEAALAHCWRDERAHHGRIGVILALVRALGDARRARAELRRTTGGTRSAVARDLAWAVRSFRRSPGFFAGVVLTLALGIGANGAVFSLVRAVLLQPLPYDHPDRLVMIWRSPLHITNDFWRRATTPAMLSGWIEQAGDVLDVAGIQDSHSLEAQVDLVTPDRARRLRGALVTPDFFDVVGVRASLGRVFSAADVSHGTTDVVVLSDALWRTAFGADPSVVGQRVRLTGNRPRVTRSFLVLGVLAPAVRFTYPDGVEIWAPKSFATVPAGEQGAIGVIGVGRLRPGVTFEAAAARMRAIHELIDPARATTPEEFRETTRLEPVADAVTSGTGPTLALLGGVSLLLLLITCATAANALFVRFTERQRELALRAALGAGRRRLIGQLFVEGAVLSAAGTAGGVAIAVVSLPALRALVPLSVPRADEMGFDWWMLAFAAVTASAVTALAAIVPAWRGSKLDVVAGLKRGAGSVSADRATSRWRRTLVGGQAAIATALLVAAALLVTSFWRLTHVPLGFDARGLFTVELRLLDARVRNPDALREFNRTLSERARAIPGIEDAALASAVPFRGVDWMWNVGLPPDPDRSVAANGRQVDPGYFRLMSMELRRGRLFTDTDGAGAPKVAVVSESFARQAFGDADPIGRVVESSVPATIVGVVGDVRYAGFAREPYPAVYVPLAQQPSELVCLLVRAAPRSGDPAPALRAAIHDVDPTLPVPEVTTVDRIMQASTADRRFYTTATAAFAGLALATTLAGLIVIVSRAVVERRKEMAIRTALGASSLRLMGLVTAQALVPVTAGVGIGLAAAWIAAPSLAPFLYSVGGRWPAAYVPVAMFVIGVSAAAGFVPARRSAVAAPSVVLRLD
jgi:putative ABC transport system permease protein